MMNKVKNQGVVTHWGAMKRHPQAMWIHHWFILSCITDECRCTRALHPDPDTAKKPEVLDPVDGFHFHDFVRHIDSVSGRLLVVEDKNAHRRNVWQWVGRPVNAPATSDPYNGY